MQQAELNHTVLHGQRVSVDFAGPAPTPMPRAVAPPRSAPTPPPPILSRPSSAASRVASREPVKVMAGPSPLKRPIVAAPDATPPASNRFMTNVL